MPVAADVVKESAAQFRGGLMVAGIRPDSPAQLSGLRKGDILVGLDKYEVLSNEDVRYVLTRPALTDAQQRKLYYLRGGKLESGKFELGE